MSTSLETLRERLASKEAAVAELEKKADEAARQVGDASSLLPRDGSAAAVGEFVPGRGVVGRDTLDYENAERAERVARARLTVAKKELAEFRAFVDSPDTIERCSQLDAVDVSSSLFDDALAEIEAAGKRWVAAFAALRRSYDEFDERRRVRNDLERKLGLRPTSNLQRDPGWYDVVFQAEKAFGRGVREVESHLRRSAGISA